MKLSAFRVSNFSPSVTAARRVVASLSLTLACLPLVHASLAWPTREIEVAAGREVKVHATIPFRNDGPAPVTITGIRTSCDCTLAASSSSVYQPGEEGRIDVEIAVKPTDTGTQRSEVHVSSDDTKGEVVIAVIVRQRAPFTVNPLRLIWRVSGPLEEQRVELRFDPETTTIKQVMYPGSDFTVILIGSEVAGQKWLKIQPTGSAGVAHAAIRIDVASAGQPRSYIVQASVK